MSTPWKRNYSKYRVYFSQIYNRYQKRDDFKAYLEIMLSLGAIIIFSVFALRPTLSTIASLSRELTSKEDALQKLDLKIESLNKVQELLLQYENEIVLLQQAMPESSEPDTAIRQLEGFIENNFVTISSLTFEEAPILGTFSPGILSTYSLGSDGRQAIKFNLTVNGLYDDLLSLLDDLESARRIITITSSAFYSGNNTNTIGLSISGYIGYYYHDDSK